MSVTARQAMKNTPKRLPSVTVRSPLGASPPTHDAQADSAVPTHPMETEGATPEDTTVHSVVSKPLHFVSALAAVRVIKV